MPEFKFEIERTYTWCKEVVADTEAEATKIVKQMMEENTFDEESAQRGYLEIVDIEER